MSVFAAFSGGKIFSGFPGFSAPTQRGARTALACSPFPGGEFSAEPQQGDSPSADGGSVPRPAAGMTPYPRRWAKRKDNLRFSFLFELLPFPCFLIRRRFPICDRCEIGNGRGFFLPCLSQPVRRVRYRSATQAVYSAQGAAQGELPEGQERVPWGIAVPRNSLARCDRQHWRI